MFQYNQKTKKSKLMKNTRAAALLAEDEPMMSFHVMSWWDQDPGNPPTHPNSDLMEAELKHDIPAQSNVMGT